MKLVSSIRFMLSILLISIAFPVVADDPDAALDAALDALKKKPKRRVYSNKALLDHRDLLIPKTLSEEEKALDRDLERLENQLDRQIIPPQSVAAPRVFSPASVPPENWITPTLLNTENGDPLSSEKSETSWIGQELARQKSIQLHEKGLAEEEALVNRLLREESRNKTSTEKSPIRAYESLLRNTISPSVIQPVSKGIIPDPLGSLRPKEEKSPSGANPLFSPTARRNSGVIQPSFSSFPSSSSSAQTPSWRPQFGSSAPKPASSFTSDWNVTKPTPLSPLKRVRQSLPIHQKDPFSDDFMPEIKTSVWD